MTTKFLNVYKYGIPDGISKAVGEWVLCRPLTKEDFHQETTLTLKDSQTILFEVLSVGAKVEEVKVGDIVAPVLQGSASSDPKGKFFCFQERDILTRINREDLRVSE